MKLVRHFVLPTAVLSAAALLLLPEESKGFNTLGGDLSLAQRDVRVFDNFADAASNDNTTAHPTFPAYTGAEMAVWKSCVEWGSLPHGDGAGDTTQTQLGDGGANFDISWQGNATQVGGTNDNIVSTISSCGGGTLAFTETPISDGWRIRFCDNFTWADGPVSIIGSHFDIQEVSTHEYGHALGLDHTNVNGATMFPSTSNGSISGRSIAADDIAGVQFIYGVAAAGKPRIDNVNGTNFIQITGINFATTGNEVWFTQGTAGGTGNPVKVLNVTSNGTSIAVGVPGGAGPGDVLVRIPGSGHDKLSNAFPNDTLAPPPFTYCDPKINSLFCGPFITFSGSPSETDTNPFTITGNDVIPNEFGYMIYSLNGQSSLNFHNGTLCVKSPFTRLAPKNSGNSGGGLCSGVLSNNFNGRIQSGVDPALVAGQQVNGQFYYRDPGIDAFNDGLSDGIEFVIQP